VPPQSSGEVPLALGVSILESLMTDDLFERALAAVREVGRRMSNPMNLAHQAATGEVVV
jgi:hypothetical protein